MIIYGIEAFNKFMSENQVQPLTDYELETIPQKLDELSGFSPICKIVTRYHFEQFDDETAKELGYRYYLHYQEAVLEYKWYHLKPGKDHHLATTFSLSFCEPNNHPYAEYFRLPNELKEKPQRIGKVTVAKMDCWLEYLLKVEKLKEDHIKLKEKEVQDFMNLLKPYEKIIYWAGKTHGIIIQGGLKYSFWTDRGNISQTLELAYGRTTLPQAFLDMSDNFYEKDKSEILVLYSCDAWHSHKSKNLISVFSSREKLNRYLKGLSALGNLQKNDLESLIATDQTQGLEINYLVESVPLNVLYKQQK